MMATVPNLLSIPLQALRTRTRETIAVRLNRTKVIPNDKGMLRDWRGLAQLAGLEGEDILLIGTKPDPTGHVLNVWTSSTLGQLTAALQQLDRYDIVDDTAAMIEQDAIKYMDNHERSLTSAPVISLHIDKQILTIDDVSRLESGLQPQIYDAFLLFADEDIDFAEQIVEKMEDKYKLKLCLRDRDLVGGLAFEHEAIMRLIAERCNRLIVIVSPSFLRSEANKFFVTFAQALGIEQRQRKVVPCLYQHCVLPPELSYYFLLDYTRSSTLWDFWAKMRDSLQTPDKKKLDLGQVYSLHTPVQRYNAIAIKEIEETSEEPTQASKYLDAKKNQPEDLKTVSAASGTSISANHHTTSGSLKPKSGKWLRRLLPKQKSKKKKIAVAL